jgi:hypothetical protein
MTPNEPTDEMMAPTLQFMGEKSICCSKGGYTLEEVAILFQKGVQVSTHRHKLRTYMKTFVGSEAVTFLVDNGYAKSREEAVTIGRQLAEKMKLFEHVLRKHEFKDAYLFYHFLILDKNKYTFTTHEPQGKSLFRMLKFLDEDINFADNQLEMPYSNGVDHPRFTVKESLVIRSKESKSMIKKLLADEEANGKYNEEDDDDAAELGMEGPIELTASDANYKMDRMESYFDLKHSPTTEQPEDPSPSMELLQEDETKEDDTVVTVKQLKKPPLQNVDFKAVSDRPITDVLAEARHKVHGVLLHCFNDRTYVVRDGETSSRLTRKPKASLRMKVAGTLSRRNKSQESLRSIPESQDGNGPTSPSRSARRSHRSDQTSAASLASEQSGDQNKSLAKNSKSDMQAAREENDKLLKIGVYSNANRWVAKIGVIVQ